MTSGLPVEVLEKRAADERRQLHDSVIELRQTVRERLNIKRNLRERVWPLAGAMALAGLMLGYAVAAVFKRN